LCRIHSSIGGEAHFFSPNVKLLAGALALVLVFALSIAIFTVQESGVHAYSVDKRMKIYSFQYFPGESMDFAYPTPPPPPSKLRIQWALLARKLGLYQAPSVQRPVPLVTVKGSGPALVVLAQIEGGNSHWLELVSENGVTINQSAPWHALLPETNLFLWNYAFYEGKKRRVVYPLTNGNYRLRFSSETNDLAIIRVRR
jgi:hypothetical protein